MRGFIVLSLGLIACGCGNPDLPLLGRVTGTVLLDGKPVPQANVTFHPSQGGRGSVGITDENGRYTLSYHSGKPGAAVGPHQVYITAERRENKGTGEKGVNEFIPKAYNEASTLTAQVVAGQNTINFSLDSKAKGSSRK